MRGPLLSGPVGSRVTLERLAARIGARGPVVVLGTTWLAAALAEALSVTLLVEPDGLKAARRARREASGRLLVAAAGEELPLRRGAAGVIVLEGTLELDERDAQTYVSGLAPYLRADGQLVGVDATKDPAAEARVAAGFLAAGLVGIGQERPREGALVTFGNAPPPAALAARLRAEKDRDALAV
jgi:hypothetical protein